MQRFRNTYIHRFFPIASSDLGVPGSLSLPLMLWTIPRRQSGCTCATGPKAAVPAPTWSGERGFGRRDLDWGVPARPATEWCRLVPCIWLDHGSKRAQLSGKSHHSSECLRGGVGWNNLNINTQYVYICTCSHKHLNRLVFIVGNFYAARITE